MLLDVAYIIFMKDRLFLTKSLFKILEISILEAEHLYLIAGLKRVLFRYLHMWPFLIRGGISFVQLIRLVILSKILDLPIKVLDRLSLSHLVYPNWGPTPVGKPRSRILLWSLSRVEGLLLLLILVHVEVVEAFKWSFTGKLVFRGIIMLSMTCYIFQKLNVSSVIIILVKLLEVDSHVIGWWLLPWRLFIEGIYNWRLNNCWPSQVAILRAIVILKGT